MQVCTSVSRMAREGLVWLCLKARHLGWIFILWQNGKDNACLARRYLARWLVMQRSLRSIKHYSSSTEMLTDFRDGRVPPRLTPLQLRSKGQGLRQERRTSPGLIPITAEISSSRKLGAGSAFRLALRAGILLWAQP